jgi:hypothetical protein
MLGDKAMKNKLAIENIDVRFFIYDEDPEQDGLIDLMEVGEETFLRTPGPIDYTRHTVWANGSRQICLTKSNGYGG